MSFTDIWKTMDTFRNSFDQYWVDFVAYYLGMAQNRQQSTTVVLLSRLSGSAIQQNWIHLDQDCVMSSFFVTTTLCQRNMDRNMSHSLKNMAHISWSQSRLGVRKIYYYF